MAPAWCRTCCTEHDRVRECPGDLRATGPERHGWRVHVETPRSHEAYGVLVAPAGELWRARILTLPNILWTIPGGGGSMKFVGRSPQEAERKAIGFIERHCDERDYQRLDQLAPVASGLIDPESDPFPPAKKSSGKPSRRKLRSLPLSFGVASPAHIGASVNLSEEGMFIATASPLDPGPSVQIRLEVAEATIELYGRVVWHRPRREPGRPAGMGVRLIRPPMGYVLFVQALP